MMWGDFNPYHNPKNGQFAKSNVIDVTDEYFSKAKPGTGSITKVPGYNEAVHKEEIAFAKYLHDTFGGDIELITESSVDGVRTPDYMWRGRSWELKNTSSLTATDDQLRNALKQIRNSPGGVILAYKDNTIPVNKIESVIKKRLSRSSRMGIDVMIVVNKKAVKILREK